MDDSTLSDCGCCEGVVALTPRSLENRPGQDALAYRVGTHGAFKATMLAGVAAEPALRGLTARQDSDAVIALLDAWATTLDVLTFYQERIANEGFLGTAEERRSILELARAIGYELRPGVAASTFLAFAIDNFPGGPTEATIPAATKAQSVPGQDETPQVFETVEPIAAKAVWNAMPVRQTIPHPPATGDAAIHLQGVGLGLEPGDALLIIDQSIEGKNWDAQSERWDFRRLTAVEEIADRTGTKSVTRVLLERTLEFTPKACPSVYVFRQRAAIFGYNAPDWRLFSAEAKRQFLGHIPKASEKGEWPHFVIYTPGTTDTIDLDRIYPKIRKNSWLVLSQPTYVELYSIEDADEASRADFGLTGKTTRVRLKGEFRTIFKNSVRTIVVYTQPELLTVAPQPLASPVAGDGLWLDAPVPAPPDGRLLAVTGEDATTGKPISEICTIKSSKQQQGTTFIALTKALTNHFKRATCSVNANVAPATHGDTKEEVLGDGNGSLAFQSFPLTFKPLTHVSGTDASGATSTLTIRVNAVRWEETPSFNGLGPHDRRYVKRIDNDGATTVTFGDGRTGARLPSGSQNVAAAYRAGQGLAGMVKAGQISLLLTRPLGVNAVVNPLAATGGDDPERLEDARRNAPTTILTLDRIVSLQDYEDFARAFAGVGKAQARLLWDGGQQLIHLTLAGADGGPFAENSQPFANLLTAIDRARHPAHRVAANTYRPVLFSLTAAVLIDADHVPETVLATARQTLTTTFSPLARDLAQGVSASEILSVLQSVDGVIAANVSTLSIPPDPPPAVPILTAPPAHWDGSGISPAALLSLDAAALTLTRMTL